MSVAIQRKKVEEFSFTEIVRFARFLRGTYGDQAMNEAQRRINTCTRDTRHELADLWKLVLLHLRGTAVTDETHRILKVRKKLTVKTTAEDSGSFKQKSAVRLEN